MAQGLSIATIKRLARQTRQQARAILEEAGEVPGEPLPAAPVDVAAGLARFIDHTLLKPEASAAQITQLCAEAREYHFATVCVNSWRVPLAAELLAGSDVAVCTVVGFPLGASLPEVKASEAGLAIHGWRRRDRHGAEHRRAEGPRPGRAVGRHPQRWLRSATRRKCPAR